MSDLFQALQDIREIKESLRSISFALKGINMALWLLIGLFLYRIILSWRNKDI